MHDALLTDLREVLRAVFNSPDMEIQPDLTFSAIEDYDSLKRLELIVSVESAFQVRFTTAETNRLDGVPALLDLLQVKVAGRAS